MLSVILPMSTHGTMTISPGALQKFQTGKVNHSSRQSGWLNASLHDGDYKVHNMNFTLAPLGVCEPLGGALTGAACHVVWL